MARVLKQQGSLDLAFKKRIGIGLGFIVAAGLIIVLFIVLFTEVALVGIIVGIILVSAGLALIRRANKFRIGAVGESHVAELLASFPKYWYVFNDMFIGHSQIDHIVVCPRGVYTIEIKHYQGTIYGNPLCQYK